MPVELVFVKVKCDHIDKHWMMERRTLLCIDAQWYGVGLAI